MKAIRLRKGLAGATDRFVTEERGALMVVAIVFAVVFVTLGIALYYLVASQTRSTETERTDVKSFNVAEAGIDAGMLSLKLDWPRASTAVATVQQSLIISALRSSNPGLYLPKVNGVEDVSAFLVIDIYDNVDPATGLTTTVANAAAPKWDSNGDGKMFIDSTANVGNDRHRILALAEKQKWEFNFPATLALWANQVDSNSLGLSISLENGSYPVYYDVQDTQHKGVDPIPADQVLPYTSAKGFTSVCSPAQQAGLAKAAQDRGTYFEGPTAADDASAYLSSGLARGAIVYVKADTGITLTGNKQIGSEDEPVVVVIDTPDGTENTWDMKGTADFWGILITIGNSTLRGTCGVHGAMYVSGTLANKGNGESGEINYNQKCIANINRQFVISVNLVPNTWEEYTLPLAAGATTTTS
jgi:hypothetical protein